MLGTLSFAKLVCSFAGSGLSKFFSLSSEMFSPIIRPEQEVKFASSSGERGAELRFPLRSSTNETFDPLLLLWIKLVGVVTTDSEIVTQLQAGLVIAENWKTCNVELKKLTSTHRYQGWQAWVWLCSGFLSSSSSSTVLPTPTPHSSVTTGTHVFIFARTFHFGQRFVEKSTELQTTKQMKKRMDLLVSSSAVNPSLILEEIVSVSRHSSD
jgi:hypothetical protein